MFLLVFLTISRVHQRFPLVASLRPAALLTGVALTYAFLNPKLLGSMAWARTWPARLVMALGVLACLSAPFGISFGASARFILDDYSKVLISALLLMAVMRDGQDLAWFSWAYVVASGALVCMAFFVFQVSLTADGALYRLSGLETWDGNDLGCVLLPGLALSLLLWRTSRGMARLLSGVVILGIAMTVARSGSRGTLVGLLVFGLAWLFSLRAVPLYRRLAVLAITGAGLSVAAPPGYWRQMGTLLHITEDYNWHDEFGRKEATLRGLQYMLDHPLFGLGVGNFGRAEGTISEVAQAWQPGRRGVPWRAAHNSYVQAGSELGVPGLVVWASLVLGGIIAMWRLRRRLPRDWMHAGRDEQFLYHAPGYLLLALVGFAVTSAFVSFAYLDPIYILAALMTGLYVAVAAKRRELGLASVPLSGPVAVRRAYRHAGQSPVRWPPRF